MIQVTIWVYQRGKKNVCALRGHAVTYPAWRGRSWFFIE